MTGCVERQGVVEVLLIEARCRSRKPEVPELARSQAFYAKPFLDARLPDLVCYQINKATLQYLAGQDTMRRPQNPG